jgi:hypothetical protein
MTDVYLPTRCACGADRCTIFEVVRIRCVGCGRDRGLLPKEATILIASISEKFGEPPTMWLRETSTIPAPDSSATEPCASSSKEPPMRSSEAFPTAYLKASDLNGIPRQVKIDRLGREEMRDGTEKHVLYFHNERRGLCLNKTNFCAIEDLYGDSDEWPGKQIVLRPDRTDFEGKRVDCIRIGVPKPTKPVSSESENPAGDFNDDPDFA